MIPIHCSSNRYNEICLELTSRLAKDGIDITCFATSLYKMPWQSHVVAFLTSYTAFNRGRNIARRMELEHMVRLFSERQISTILNTITQKLYDDRHIVIVHSRSRENDKDLNRIIGIIENIVKSYSCVYIDWDELLKRSTHIAEVLGVFRQFKESSVKGLEKNLDKILLGVSGCNSILIE